MARRRPERGVLWVMLAASASVHLAIALPLREKLGNFLAARPRGPAPPVRVVSLSPEQWSQNLRTAPGARPTAPRPAEPRASPAEVARAPAAAAPEPTPTPSPSPEERPTGQIVDVAPTADETPDPNARFLSRVNARVEKETSARLSEVDRKASHVTPKLQREGSDAEAALKVPPPQPTKKGSDRAQDAEAREAEQRFVLKVPEILRREGLDLPQLPGSGTTVVQRRHIAPVPGSGRELEVELGKGQASTPAEEGGQAGAREGTGDRPVPTLSALLPTLGTLDRINGAPREGDVEGVELGDATFLNTREFKYATFYLRVRDAIADQWEGAVAREYRRRDPMGNIYGARDRTTMVSVTLQRGGELVDVKVQETSGVDFLDDVAVDSLKRAQPFPNPPSGIVDEDGLIRFSFAFRLVLGAQNPFQFKGIVPQ